VDAALARGLLINVTAGSVVRLLPPLIIDDDQATEIIDEVAGLILEFLQTRSDDGAGTRP